MAVKVNIVIVEHLNPSRDSYGSAGYYTFGVPEPYTLHCGDFVVVDTAKGPNQLARCICDSFHADPDIAFPILGVKKGKLKPVKAVMEPLELMDIPDEPMEDDANAENG